MTEMATISPPNESALVGGSVAVVADAGWSTVGAAFAEWLGADVLPSAEPTDHDLLVVLLDAFDGRRLELLDVDMAARRQAWVPVHVSAGKGFIGPLVVPGATSDYRDLLTRRTGATSGLWVDQLELSYRPYAPTTAVGQAERRWLLSQLALRLGGGAPRIDLASVELELDLVTFSVERHPVLPLPDRMPPNYVPVHTPDDLVDGRTGIVTMIAAKPLSSASTTGRQSVAQLGDLASYFDGWIDDRQGYGMTLGADDVSRHAVSEILEAYCGAYVGQVPLVERDSGRPLVRATSLADGEEILIPAAGVFLNWARRFGNDDPTDGVTSIAGLAAGPTIEIAVTSAIEEIVERDSMMVWWLNGPVLPRLAASTMLDEIWPASARRGDQEVSFLVIPNGFAIPVVCAIVRDRAEGLLNLGFAARHSVPGAASKALAEALTLQDGSRDLLDPDGPIRQAIEAGVLHIDDLKPWRADRNYAQSYACDFRDVTSLLCQQQYHLDRAAQARIDHVLNGPEAQSPDDVPEIDGRRSATYVQRLRRAGFTPSYVDLTTPDVAACGWCVVRVVVPGLVPNAPAAFPPLGYLPRILGEGERLGWRRPTEPAALNLVPLPYA